jgi:hypothetical protein
MVHERFLDFFEAGKGLLQAISNRRRGVPEVVNHHVHEEFELVQLLLQLRHVTLLVFGHLLQMVYIQ